MDDLQIKYLTDAAESIAEGVKTLIVTPPWDDVQIDTILAEYRCVEAIKFIAEHGTGQARLSARREIWKWSNLGGVSDA